MQYRELSTPEFDRKLRAVIVGAEGLHERVQDIGDRRATIGWGYTMNRSNNVQTWRASGLELSLPQWQTLASVDAAPSQGKTRIALAFDRRLDARDADRLLSASMREYEGPANALRMPLSEERIAMISLAYNRGPGMLLGVPAERIPEHPIMEAIRRGDRAEAWFHFRYNAWGSDSPSQVYPNTGSNEPGLRKRRLMEAHVFGLYDDADAVTEDEAHSVYRSFSLHRVEIERVEAEFGITVDGQGAGRNLIALANRDFALVAGEYGPIPLIAAALEPARNVLVEDLRRRGSDAAEVRLSDDVAVGRIYLDPQRELQTDDQVARMYPGTTRTVLGVRREQRNATVQQVEFDHGGVVDSRTIVNERERSRDDVLLAGAGDDTLRGGLGADILLGGAGDDRYEVDAGDIVKDSDGRGTLVWAGRVLDGGVLDPVTGQFRSADGAYTYVLEATRLVITNTAGESVRVEGFHAGNLGIRLDTTDHRAHDAPMPLPMDPRNPAHRDHALFQQAERAVALIDADLARDRDASSERMIAAGVLLARANGLERIDHLLLSRQTVSTAAGHNVFVVCGPLDDPASLRAHMPTATALGTPSQQSYAQIEALRPDRSQDVDLHLQRHDIEAKAVHRMQGA